MSDLGPYARVYQSIRTDPRFAGIIESNELLGAWLRLLLHAESEWPESPPIPRSIPDDLLRPLVDAGIVELHPADTYRIHGLDPERQRRSEHAIEANRRRWHPEECSGDSSEDPPRTPQSLLDTRRVRDRDTKGIQQPKAVRARDRKSVV